MNKLVITIIGILLILLPVVALGSSEGSARLTLVQGDVQLFDEESGEWLPAAPNTPIGEGDRLWSPTGAHAEIQLDTGSYLRLGEDTALDVVRLDADNRQVYLDRGRLYVSTSGTDRDLQVDSEDATVNIGEKSRVGVDMIGTSDSEVSVIKGSAYVESVSGRTRVRSGEALIFSENGAEIAALREPDEWEWWNEKRNRTLDSRTAKRGHLPDELAIYEDELAANGEWVVIEDYGYVWRPTVHVVADWTPYREGRWVWRRGGYVWIATEPWGWAPHHYGRWQHSSRWGWCWVPPRRGDVFWSPGYVAWVGTTDDMAWVPLAPNEVYYGYGNYGSLSINITHVDQRTIVRPVNVYRNARVRNSITVINRNSFVRGQGAPRRWDAPNIDRRQVAPIPPAFKPAGREARMPLVRKIAQR
ncbi:MAG: FecR domain-containing protein, partial [Geobacter sp.]|nr:FecR domain-containing protein [Geobacter sp.]